MNREYSSSGREKLFRVGRQATILKGNSNVDDWPVLPPARLPARWLLSLLQLLCLLLVLMLHLLPGRSGRFLFIQIHVLLVLLLADSVSHGNG